MKLTVVKLIHEALKKVPALQAAAADLDGDGTTGGSDVGLLLAAWGECPRDGS